MSECTTRDGGGSSDRLRNVTWPCQQQCRTHHRQMDAAALHMQARQLPLSVDRCGCEHPVACHHASRRQAVRHQGRGDEVRHR